MRRILAIQSEENTLREKRPGRVSIFFPDL